MNKQIKIKPRQQLINYDLQLKINGLMDKLAEANKEEEISGNQFHGTLMTIGMCSHRIKNHISDDGWDQWELQKEEGYLSKDQKWYNQCINKRRRIESQITKLQKRII